MEILLPYGSGNIPFIIEDYRVAEIISVDEPPPVNSLKEKVLEALYNPVNSPPFDRVFKRGDRVLIIVSDITRYTGAELFLPIVIEHLEELGVKEISILVATALHRPQNPEDIKRIVGGDVYKRVDILNHDPYDRNRHVYLGKTRRDTEVWLNRKLFEVDHLILTGSINFHYFAGFGGGKEGYISWSCIL